MSNLTCHCCGAEMEPQESTFTVVKPDAVHIVEGVPSWHCSRCGQLIFDQAVAEALHLYSTRRIAPDRKLTALVYKWRDMVGRPGRVRPRPILMGLPRAGFRRFYEVDESGNEFILNTRFRGESQS